jgi:hypothetical protein
MAHFPATSASAIGAGPAGASGAAAAVVSMAGCSFGLLQPIKATAQQQMAKRRTVTSVVEQ